MKPDGAGEETQDLLGSVDPHREGRYYLALYITQ